MTIDNKEQNNLSILEQYMESESFQDAYTKLCNINYVSNSHKIDDENQYYHCNNVMRCKVNVEYIVRLSRHNKRKALTIIDGRADTHVFGRGWLPLFERGPHTQTADLVGFDSAYAKKHDLAIGPHAALARTNKGELIILRAEHGVSNPTANHMLLSIFKCRTWDNGR